MERKRKHKYNLGDVVRVKDKKYWFDLKCKIGIIVEISYTKGQPVSYSLFMKDYNQIAWLRDNQLELIESNKAYINQGFK